MLTLPTEIAHINKIIDDKIQEDLHLDYKDSAALDKNNRKEISKDVSAFANSDGGIIIYGIAEVNNLPEKSDAGVDHKKFSRETLENIITSNINPRIDNIIISPIPISETTSIYAVKIPRSDRAPHQASDGKYYKRFNFKSEPMADYEINDVRNRRIVVLPLISISAEIHSNRGVYINISNVSPMPALDVTFSFSKSIKWIGNRETPSLITNGTKYFPPNKTFNFFWNTIHYLFSSAHEYQREFDACVTYRHPQTNLTITDTFHIDLENYRGNTTLKSDLTQLSDVLKELLSKLTDQISQLNKKVETLERIVGASGLELSVTTLRNLKHIISGDDNFEKIDPINCSYGIFQEVLDIRAVTESIYGIAAAGKPTLCIFFGH